MIYKLMPTRVKRLYLGGKKLDLWLGKENAEPDYYPEDWIASITSAYNPGYSTENEGLSKTLQGEFLKDIIQKNPVRMLGKKHHGKYGSEMSFLLKIIDSEERLLIQVHPDAEFAKKHFGSRFGKTECWYIMESEENAFVYLGFKKGISRSEWMECFEKQDINKMKDMLHKIPVQEGDVFFVPGGIPHAIGKGIMLCEIQEPTDLMVVPERFTGSSRRLPDEKMHGGLGFDKMFDCFDYSGYTHDETEKKYKIKTFDKKDGIKVLVDEKTTPLFKMEKLEVSGMLDVDYGNDYVVGLVLKGNGKAECKTNKAFISQSDRFFVPSQSGPIKFHSHEDGLDIIICTLGCC